MAVCPANLPRELRTRFYWSWARSYADEARRLRFRARNTSDLDKRIKLEDEAFQAALRAAENFKAMRRAICE